MRDTFFTDEVRATIAQKPVAVVLVRADCFLVIVNESLLSGAITTTGVRKAASVSDLITSFCRAFTLSLLLSRTSFQLSRPKVTCFGPSLIYLRTVSCSSFKVTRSGTSGIDSCL